MRAWLALCAALIPAAVFAEPRPDSGTRVAYSHKGQVGIQVQSSYGFRALFPYDQGDYCGEVNQPVCTGPTPVYLDLGLTYGASRAVELLAELRLAWNGDFKPMGAAGDSPLPLAFAPGIKYYIDDAGSMKFFSTLQVMFDFTDFSQSGAAAGVDVGVRNVNGLLLDLHRTFGLYLEVGDTITIVRWLRIEMDVGLGLQARFP